MAKLKYPRVIWTHRVEDGRRAKRDHHQAVKDVGDLFLKLEGERLAAGGLPYESDRFGFKVLAPLLTN